MFYIAPQLSLADSILLCETAGGGIDGRRHRYCWDDGLLPQARGKGVETIEHEGVSPERGLLDLDRWWVDYLRIRCLAEEPWHQRTGMVSDRDEIS